jgi:hypothetical protein
MDVYLTRRALRGTLAAAIAEAENGRYADCKTALVSISYRRHENMNWLTNAVIGERV